MVLLEKILRTLIPFLLKREKKKKKKKKKKKERKKKKKRGPFVTSQSHIEKITRKE
jgi:hypothetical protein